MMLTFFLVLFGVEITSTISTTGLFTSAWTYNDESNWPGDKCHQGGRKQSPIDIETSKVIRDYREDFIRHGSLKFTGYSQVLMTGINSGQTIQYTCEGDQTIHPLMTGGPLKHLYRLDQLHFHWFSEHAVDGIKFPMEIHMVHVRVDLTLGDALLEKDGLATLAIFCNVLPEVSPGEEELTIEILNSVPKLSKVGTAVSGLIFDLSKLLPKNVNSYFAYSGSLTTPECHESVIWIIFDTSLNITPLQYNQFSKLGIDQNNFRRLQPTDRHQVYRPVISQVDSPYMVSVIQDVGRAFVQFFRRLTGYFQQGVYKKTLN